MGLDFNLPKEWSEAINEAINSLAEGLLETSSNATTTTQHIKYPLENGIGYTRAITLIDFRFMVDPPKIEPACCGNPEADERGPDGELLVCTDYDNKKCAA